MNMTKTNKN